MKGYKTSISIIGGGPVGSSIAYHLAKFGFQNITVIERDKTYKIASSMLSAGGIRQQFSLKENILMSEYGARFVKNATRDTLQNNELPDVQFHENGYLFLATQPETLLKNHETQRSCGIDWMKIYNPQELKENFPWLNSDGIALGSYGTRNEGYFDPWGFVAYLKQQVLFLIYNSI
jgi:FAD-dependent oxidoreductase domain-containing protein 1